MKQEQSNYSKIVNEEAVNAAKRALNQAAVCNSEPIKKDIVINSASPLPMGLVPAAQLITLQLNNVTSKPLEKLSAGPIFTSQSRGHNIPVPILAKPVSPNVPRRRLCNSAQESTFPCQNYNRFRHKGSQTESAIPQPDTFVDAIKKIAVTLDEMKVKLTSVQSKVVSLEARFSSIYGDETILTIPKPPKSEKGGKLRSIPRRKRPSFVLNSSRFWASRRLACRLAAEKLQQREEVNGEGALPRPEAPPPPPPALTRSTVPVRRSRRFITNGGCGREQTAPVTKAKIAKLLMDARLEMAAEERERLESRTSASTSASSGEDIKSAQSIGPASKQSNISDCLSANRDDEEALAPILPLLSVSARKGETGELTTSTGKDVKGDAPTSDLVSRGSPSKSVATTVVVTPGGTSSVSSTSPSSLPQLPPIPAKYRRPMLLDTSEIARQTKDMLLKCAISQRSFGQNVLGLSQGSVSDLLTRPKPWSMLTNKGREPFIRMKLFLENPRSLNGFEYNISAGKEGTMAIKQEKSEDISSKSRQESPAGNPAGTLKSTAMGTVSAPSPVTSATTPVASFTSKSESCGRSSITIRSPEAQRLLKEGFDVMKTVADAKLLLNTTSMTQRALGNTVLGLSQASVSDLLCKCRPWDQISGNKPRESYVRLKLWVDSVHLTSGLPDDVGDSVSERKSKRLRTESGSSAAVDVESRKLTDQQLDVLVNFFDQCPEPDLNDISELAKQICCSLDDVNDWFEKRRMGGKPLTPASIVREDNPQNAMDKDGSPTPPNNQSPVSTASLNRRKKTVPTRILPSSLEAPTESTVPPHSTT